MSWVFWIIGSFSQLFHLYDHLTRDTGYEAARFVSVPPSSLTWEWVPSHRNDSNSAKGLQFLIHLVGFFTRYG